MGTSRNFILRGTFNDGFLGVVQVRGGDVAMTSVWVVTHPGPGFENWTRLILCCLDLFEN